MSDPIASVTVKIPYPLLNRGKVGNRQFVNAFQDGLPLPGGAAPPWWVNYRLANGTMKTCTADEWDEYCASKGRSIRRVDGEYMAPGSVFRANLDGGGLMVEVEEVISCRMPVGDWFRFASKRKLERIPEVP